MQKVALGVWRLVCVFAMLLLGMLVLSTLLQVLSRYVLRHPFDWTEEVARYVFIWVAMIGAGMAAKDRAHFFVDLLLERLPPELGRYVTLGVGIVSTAFLLVVSWAAVELAVSNQVQDSPVLTVPMSVPYLAIPAGLILMALFTLIDTWRILRRTERSGRTDAEEGGDIPGAPVKR
jgi:TRAP-type C4-dicarboxylate transport system permease small subunit